MTLGERLKKARQDAGLTLKKAADLSKIQLKYLEVLEQGQYEKLPAYVYMQGAFKKYAEILGLSSQELMKEYEADFNFLKQKGQIEGLGQLPRLKSPRALVTPKIITVAIVCLVFLFIVGYLGYQVMSLMSPPPLVLNYPSEDLTISVTSIQILGSADVASKLTLNGEQIYVDKSGNFKQDVNLSPGVNTLKIEATNRFGKKSEIIRRVVVEGQDQNQ